MKRYGTWAPTALDRAGAFLPDRADWYVVPAGRNRDSQPAEESNFAAALALLGGESDTVEVHRFGHWGPGWFEVIIAAPSREADVRAIADKLENYQLLDEDDTSRRAWEAAEESWDNWGRFEFKRALEGAFRDMGDDIDEASNEALDALACLADGRDMEPGLPEFETGGDGPHFRCLWRGGLDGLTADDVRAAMAKHPAA